MKPLSSDEIRSKFLKFFAERAHEIVPSSPLVPQNDPTLLFTNAGMVQFKDLFTGREKRSYTRATSSQKCVRAGGKHNDLENVGYTARHHTFFEMLGNFSFGDYFKKEAIDFAWTFITRELGMPQDRLCVTVFRGEDGIPADDEAAEYWEAVGVPKSHIFRLGKSENYWQMGDTGPQGPCSEIHYFLGDDLDKAFDEKRVETSDGWFEIWNLVFMQFNKDSAEGPLESLPRPSVDTGAGLERLAVVLQNKHSNYDTDVFDGIIGEIAKAAGKKYGHTDSEDDVSMRVIADHARATAFLVSDGVQPSNEGRGYVLRRIMRRAIRHGRRLGFEDLFFHSACDAVIDRMGGVYPELEKAKTLIEKVAKNEETSFRRTLDQGLRLIEREIESVKSAGGKSLDRMFVATMYDTNGFPIDLTRVIANERGLTVDEDDARRAVEEIQAKSRVRADLGSGQAVDAIWFELHEEVGPTRFTGYDKESGPASVRAIVVDGKKVARAKTGDVVAVLLSETPFYAESGGQVGDRGRLFTDGLAVEITDTIKPRPDMHVHVGQVVEGTLEVGHSVEAVVDSSARDATRKNHSATHLLHLALKEVLGDHVQQKGSLVAPDRLRFDFSHFEPITPAQIDAIERRANEMVLRDDASVTKEVSIEEAQAEGATMLFGEKYSERVRMIRISDSLELCGGTHVHRTGEIGMIKIVSDSNIAAGIRRMEAVTGLNALSWVQRQAHLVGQTEAVAKTGLEEIPARLEKLMKRTKELERQLDAAKADAAMASKSQGDVMDKIQDIGGVRVLVHRADGTPIKALRGVSDKLRDRLQSGVVVLGTSEGDKAAVLVAATADLAGKVHAGKVVQAAADAMGGKGGGRPDFAQGGGEADRLDAALQMAEQTLRGTLQN